MFSLSPSVVSIIVLILAIVGYVTEILPSAVIALGSCCLMVIFGGQEPNKIFAPFGEDNVLLMAGMLVLGITLSNNGVMTGLARAVGKVFHNNTERMILALYICLFFISGFINNSSAVLCFLPLFLEIIIESNNPEQHYEQKYVQAISIVAHCGGMLTIIGSGVNLTASGLLESYGFEGFNFFSMAPYGICLFVISIIYIYVFGNRITKSMRDNPTSDLVIEFRKNYLSNVESPKNWNTKTSISLLILIFAVLLLTTTDYHGISRGTIGIATALMCVISGCLEFKVMINKLNWKAILTLGGMLGFSKCLAYSGGAQLIAESFLGLFGDDISPVMLLVVFTLCAFLMTQFVSNASTASILVPIAIPIATSIGVAPKPCVIAIAVASSCAFLTPMASYLQAIIMDWGSYRFSDYFKYSWLLSIFCLVSIIIITVLLYPLC